MHCMDEQRIRTDSACTGFSGFVKALWIIRLVVEKWTIMWKPWELFTVLSAS